MTNSTTQTDEFVIVRRPFNGSTVAIEIVKLHTLDLNEYALLRKHPSTSMDEYVHQSELERYKRLVESGKF